MLIVNTFTFPSRSASSLKRFVWASQTPVSSEGTTLIIFGPSKSDKDFGDKSLANTVKSGALSPTFNSSPTSTFGAPLNVILAMREFLLQFFITFYYEYILIICPIIFIIFKASLEVVFRHCLLSTHFCLFHSFSLYFSPLKMFAFHSYPVFYHLF